jgi:hypothetical protein
VASAFPWVVTEFLFLLLSKRTDLLPGLIYSGHWVKLVLEVTQQAFPSCDIPRRIGIQPHCGSIVKRKGKKSKVD